MILKSISLPLPTEILASTLLPFISNSVKIAKLFSTDPLNTAIGLLISFGKFFTSDVVKPCLRIFFKSLFPYSLMGLSDNPDANRKFPGRPKFNITLCAFSSVSLPSSSLNLLFTSSILTTPFSAALPTASELPAE